MFALKVADQCNRQWTFTVFPVTHQIVSLVHYEVSDKLQTKLIPVLSSSFSLRVHLYSHAVSFTMLLRLTVLL